MTMAMSQIDSGIDQAMRQCIQNCQVCHTTCLQTVSHCLRKGGRHAEADHIRLMLDCVEICQTAANFMIRGSDLHPYTCGACAAVCERCAEDCERLGDDDWIRVCAAACRRCAESCREMAGSSLRI